MLYAGMAVRAIEPGFQYDRANRANNPLQLTGSNKFNPKSQYKYPQQCETADLISSIDATYTIKNGPAALGYSVTNHSLLQIDKHFGY